MKLGPASTNPAAHTLESVFRVGQLALVLWLAVHGAKWAAGALMRAAAALSGLFA